MNIQPAGKLRLIGMILQLQNDSLMYKLERPLLGQYEVQMD